MRQMRGEDTGLKYRSPCANIRFMINWKRKRDLCHTSRRTRDSVRWKSEALRATIREMTQGHESCKRPRASWYSRISGTQVSINLYASLEDMRESSMHVHQGTACGA